MSDQVPGPLLASAGERLREWIEYVSALDVSSIDNSLPRGDRLADTLRWLDVPEDAIPEIVAARPDHDRHPVAWWILTRSVGALVQGMGKVGEFRPFPDLPADLPGAPPHLYIHAFVGTLPHVLAYHRERGISEEQSRAILSDLGRNVRVHDKRHGEVGLGVVSWITLHFRGLIYDLGRLQFERSLMGDTISGSPRMRGLDTYPNAPVLSMHIPDFKGPLTPGSVDAAVDRAKVFFAKHFPEERYRFAVCHSWLLDPQLKRYLRPESNIVRFQERFQIADRVSEADRSIVQFVFGPVPDDPAKLPERTSLERAVRAHLVSGGHWHARSGWLPLDG